MIGDRHRILCVVGARPNFMKIAPILRALAQHAPSIEAVLVHTGQHYDAAMNDRFFAQLRIRAPDVSLEVGSGSHAQQTAEIMLRFEPVVDEYEPDAVLVVGDVNSTIACALVAAKKNVRVIHVEAGLRSRDRQMPEEINRLLTDQLSDRLYVTERDAITNLLIEGIDESRIVFVGNVMIDTLLDSLSAAVPPQTTLSNNAGEDAKARERWSRIGADGGFGLVTLHRPSNVDDAKMLEHLCTTLVEVSERLPLVFPLHPRTRQRVESAGLWPLLERGGILTTPPLGYLETVGLLRASRVVLTDSGGLQEEATALGVPCLTLRDNTERPITITHGTNRLVGTDASAIRLGIENALGARRESASPPELWDGHAAVRIVKDLEAWMASPSP